MYGCFKPKRVINQYTGAVLYAPCRDCDFCRNRRSYELSDRIEREFLNAGATADVLFVTLDYNNEGIPVYAYNEDTGYWLSNREDYTSCYDDDGVLSVELACSAGLRYLPIKDSELGEYYYPVKYGNKLAFGHLCYPDVLKWMHAVRDKFAYDFGEVKVRGKLVPRSEEVKELFGELSYEEVKFRYFLCGEYGPTSFRPHYHLLLWFGRRYTDEQYRYLCKVLSSNWSFGRTVVKAATSRGVKNYLASYVTSSAGLPEVLRAKSLRPFCTFSKAPIIGAYHLGKDEIFQMLDTGVTKVSEWNSEEKEFTDVLPASSLYVRYFPRCRRFAYETRAYKLRVYRYIYDYYRGLQVAKAIEVANSYGFIGYNRQVCIDILSSVPYHSEDEAKNLRLIDVPDSDFPLYPSEVKTCESWRSRSVKSEVSITDWDAVPDVLKDNPAFGDVYTTIKTEVEGVLKSYAPRYLVEERTEQVKEWSYADKYASLVCYRYCVMFGVTPEFVLDAIERIYSVRSLDMLKAQFEDQETKQNLPYCKPIREIGFG